MEVEVVEGITHPMVRCLAAMFPRPMESLLHAHSSRDPIPATKAQFAVVSGYGRCCSSEAQEPTGSSGSSALGGLHTFTVPHAAQQSQIRIHQ